MSDSEGSDSDGSYGGRKKMRRDEAEEVAEFRLFLVFLCIVAEFKIFCASYFSFTSRIDDLEPFSSGGGGGCR